MVVLDGLPSIGLNRVSGAHRGGSAWWWMRIVARNNSDRPSIILRRAHGVKSDPTGGVTRAEDFRKIFTAAPVQYILRVQLYVVRRTCMYPDTMRNYIYTDIRPYYSCST